ncbi:MAG: DUF2283 domain-containing protein [Cyanobacteriota bacterium]|nr:DUF2283 domain-containing protein [Cyanobacteriota bacterium]
MKYQYYSDTDRLYIERLAEAGVESYEIEPDIVVDLNRYGEIIGFDVDHASQHLKTQTPQKQDVEQLFKFLVEMASIKP